MIFLNEIILITFVRCTKLLLLTINSKKITPTPKSITHKKPIKIPPSPNNNNNPPLKRYKPPQYHDVKILGENIKYETRIKR